MQNQSPNNKYLLSLELDKILSELSDCAITTPAKEMALNLVPYSGKEKIEKEINLTTEAKNILDNNGINSMPVNFAINPDKILTNAIISINNITDLTIMLFS